MPSDGSEHVFEHGIEPEHGEQHEQGEEQQSTDEELEPTIATIEDGEVGRQKELEDAHQAGNELLHVADRIGWRLDGGCDTFGAVPTEVQCPPVHHDSSLGSKRSCLGTRAITDDESMASESESCISDDQTMEKGEPPPAVPVAMGTPIAEGLPVALSPVHVDERARCGELADTVSLRQRREAMARQAKAHNAYRHLSSKENRCSVTQNNSVKDQRELQGGGCGSTFSDSSHAMPPQSRPVSSSANGPPGIGYGGGYGGYRKCEYPHHLPDGSTVVVTIVYSAEGEVAYMSLKLPRAPGEDMLQYVSSFEHTLQEVQPDSLTCGRYAARAPTHAIRRCQCHGSATAASL